MEIYHHHKSEEIYLICFSESFKVNSGQEVRFIKDAREAAYALYFEWRAAEESDCKLIAIELPPNEDQWNGVIDKIKKASC